MLATVDHAADTDRVTLLELRYRLAHRHHAADDLVPRYARIHRAVPFAAHRVQVRVAYAAEQDLDGNVMHTWHAPLEAEWSKRRAGVLRRVGARVGFVLTHVGTPLKNSGTHRECGSGLERQQDLKRGQQLADAFRRQKFMTRGL